MLAVNGYWCLTGGLLYVHLLLKGVHKYTDIFDTVGLLVLKGVVVIEGGTILFPSHTYIHINIHTDNHACMPKTYITLFSGFLEFPDFLICSNLEFRNTENMCICM